jgi:hypothetical protein
MKKGVYKVYFTTGLYKIVRAFNEKEATILAQAERITEGKSYEVIKVEGVSND